jgi:hypothetical protein
MDRPGATSARRAAATRTALIRGLLADRRVRRVQLAFSGFNLAEYGVWVSVLVYAYQRGGTAVTGAVAVAQLLPAAVLAPVLARAVDRRGAAAALARGYWSQAVALGAASALLLVGAPDLLVYGAAVIAAVAVTITRPAHGALAPALVQCSEQLTAINVLSGSVESASVLVGPALAGVLIAIGGPGVAVGFFALCVTASSLFVGRLSAAGIGAPGSGEPSADQCDVRPDEPRGGPALPRGDRGVGALIGLLGAQYFVIGVLDVLLVVLAIRILGLGPSGPGYLDAAFGAGGVVGAAAAIRLVGRGRLSAPLIWAALALALVLVVLGAWPTAAGAFALLAAAGTARSVLDVSGRTILVRAAPSALRGRVLGWLEGAAMLGLALGSALAPLLAALGGAGAGLIAIGALLGVAALAAVAGLQRVDEASAAREPLPAGAAVGAFIS